MTTDITELAHRLKLEVHRAVSNFSPQMNIKTRDLKELVEALGEGRSAIPKNCGNGMLVWRRSHASLWRGCTTITTLAYQR
ncbi:Uncharacterised protein [Klebsiella pneumoniae subsp. ozaenae]|uniref:Uncharacterized protein n=1 Tax=Klebsiella pneumoniae subsp. ozaenae TaxID=574 RepID=A0A378ACA9_KLEPO|nr:Uncharacterised protein [Klebsiella pneumoniae subsp. ozaenae]